MKHLLPILVLLFTTPMAFGQGDKESPKNVSVRSNLMVLNDAGERVKGIKQNEVKIFESGVEQQLTSFAEIEQATDVTLVVDNTGSVRTQLDDIARIGKIIVANLGPNDNATIIRFVGRDHIEIEQQWTNNQAQLNEALDNLFAEGGQSAVLDALYLASEDLVKRVAQSNKRKYAIVLISDGEDRDSYYSEKDLFKLLETSPIQIFTITLTKDLPKGFWDMEPNRKTVGWVLKFVNRLAANTGGTSFIFKQKSTRDDLLNALKALMIELRSQYVVGYTSMDIKKDNNVRKLSATIADGPAGEKRKAYIKETIVMIPPK